MKYIIFTILLLSSATSLFANQNYKCGYGWGYHDPHTRQWVNGYGYGCRYSGSYTAPGTSPSPSNPWNTPSYGNEDNDEAEVNTYNFPKEIKMIRGERRYVTNTTVSCGEPAYDDAPIYESNLPNDELSLQAGDYVELKSKYLIKVDCN